MGKMHIYIPGQQVETRDCAKRIKSLDVFHEWLPRGYVERCRCLFGAKECEMFVHESGRLLRLPVNVEATSLRRAWVVAMGGDASNEIIVGPAIVLEGAKLA